MLIVGKIYEKEVGNMKNTMALSFNNNVSFNVAVSGYPSTRFDMLDIPASMETSS